MVVRAGEEAVKYFQSHDCGGYRATVTIEWFPPDDVEECSLGSRGDKAEELAESVLSFSAPKVREIVQAMRGFTK